LPFPRYNYEPTHPAVHDNTVTKHIHERIHLVHKECVQKDPSKKNMIIQYNTHDVVAFRETHLLRPPAGFTPQLIESERHLLELAHALEKLGHLCGKKHELQSNFMHHHVVVLLY
jgi:hypothetical protein